MRPTSVSPRLVPLFLVALAGVHMPAPASAAPSAAPTGIRVPAPPTATPLRYRISFENREHREARVSLRISDVGPGPVALRMARTSPGRYALHEFAKNVYDVRITDGQGRPVQVDRPDPHQWTVSGHGGEVRVEYTLYADRGDGTYSQVDRTHAHLNVPATFMYAPDLMERPVELAVDLPPGSGWSVATQLAPTDDPGVFRAPDAHYFMDSPLEIADLDRRSWTVTTDHGPRTIQVAMHHLGTDEELDRYAAQAGDIAAELAAVFGGWPDFEFGTYTFLACYVPWASGDGMEHRNSTVLTSTGSLAQSMTGLLGTVAHEFVHAWNMERIRSKELEPFDFEDQDMSRELWFGEGFTSYLDDLALVRAGVIDTDEFVRRVGAMAAQVVAAPGRRFFSPVEMSMQAPFVDAATSVDPTNRANTFLSYYTYGSGVGLALDLTLRSRFDDLSLEDLMQEMWRRHGEPERPYDVDDIELALAAVTGDADFARSFFDAYVRGSEAPDYEALFEVVGVDWGPRADAPLYLTEAFLRVEDGGALVASNTVAGDPLYEAGVDRGDRLVRVDGAVLASPDDLDAVLRRASPGERLQVVVEGRGGTRTVSVEVARRPAWAAESDDDAPADALRERADWVASRAGR
jgi:predicted metalloprotease with PDZ domain